MGVSFRRRFRLIRERSCDPFEGVTGLVGDGTRSTRAQLHRSVGIASGRRRPESFRVDFAGSRWSRSEIAGLGPRQPGFRRQSSALGRIAASMCEPAL